MRKFALALGLCACLSTTAFGQISLSGASAADWTVLTMAPDGAWGTGTDPYVNRAIAAAIARCRAMSTHTLGCGAYQAATQRGFSLGLRCGGENILAVGATLAEATESARQRAQLRRQYVPRMESCRLLVMVAPDGAATIPRPDTITSDLSTQR